MRATEAARARLAAEGSAPERNLTVVPDPTPAPQAHQAGLSTTVPAPTAKRPDPARVLFRLSAAAYELLTSDGRAYAVPKAGTQLPREVHGTPGVALALGPSFGHRLVQFARANPVLVPSMVTQGVMATVMLHLESEAATRGRAVSLPLRFAHDPAARQVVIDLGRPEGGFVVVGAGGWSVADAPPTGVVFRRSHATLPLPTPARGGRLDELAPLLALDPGSEVFRALVGWLVGLAFSASVRPGVLAVGAPGTGKSTRVRLVASVVEPSPTSSLGSAFGRNFADDQVRALHRAVPIWDNLTAVSGTVSDELCTLVTGTARESRALYSDNELNAVPIARPIALTAVGIPAGLRPDALDRLITLDVPPIGHRTDDAEIQARFDAAHPRLLGAVCEAVAVALEHLDKVPAPGQFRMGAHVRVLAALDAATAAGRLPGCPAGLLDAYASLDRQAKQRTAADDTFGAALLAMLEAAGGSWMGRATELLTAAAFYVPHGDRGAGWPSSARRVPEVLNHLRDGLAALGVSWITTTVRGKTRYSFVLASDEAAP